MVGTDGRESITYLDMKSRARKKMIFGFGTS